MSLVLMVTTMYRVPFCAAVEFGGGQHLHILVDRVRVRSGGRHAESRRTGARHVNESAQVRGAEEQKARGDGGQFWQNVTRNMGAGIEASCCDWCVHMTSNLKIFRENETHCTIFQSCVYTTTNYRVCKVCAPNKRIEFVEICAPHSSEA